ncbi:MAG: hypothetical protein ACI9GW_000901 [Halieaceae bacterium]|jgi:hypothetical protein
MGALDTLFWNLFQTYGYDRETEMNIDPLLLVAASVFALMVTGLVYSMNEFLAISDDPSIKKDSD